MKACIEWFQNQAKNLGKLTIVFQAEIHTTEKWAQLNTENIEACKKSGRNYHL